MSGRILIARHGEATYDHPELISDEGGRLTDLGVAQAERLGRQLRPERVVAVYASPLRRAEQTGEVAGAELRLDGVTVLDGLREFGVGEYAGRTDGDPGLREIYRSWSTGDLEPQVPGADSGVGLVARFRVAGEQAVAAHPGATVLAISHGGVMSVAIPNLCHNIPASLSRHFIIANCAVAHVRIDEDGQWSLEGDWPGKLGPMG